MERRKIPRKDWVVGKDDIGHAVLEWKVDYRATKRQESDPLARTYDFLKRLDVPDLVLEEDAKKAGDDGRDPYDTGEFAVKFDRR
jgi:hypothetical protein